MESAPVAAPSSEAVKQEPVPAPGGPTPEEAAEQRRLTRLYLGTGLSAILLYASFHPIDQGGLAWVALVPWLFVAATSGSRRAAAAVSYSVTFLYHLVGLSWIAVVSPEGWLTTTFLEGFYGIALACIPLWVLRRTGLPLCLSLPVVGAGLEWLRGNTPVIRFPWLLLGQTQHANDTLIQVLDLTSVYGLTFLVLAVNGGLVDAALLVRARWLGERDLDAGDRRRLALALALPLGLVALAWCYGSWRLNDVRAALEPGPRIVVVQPDFPQNLKDAPAKSFDIARTNLDLTDLALARLAGTSRERPRVDAIVWSETMWPGWRFPDLRTPLDKEEFDGWLERLERRYGSSHAAAVRSYTRQLLSLPDHTGATVLVGAVDWGTSEETMHNSIYALRPGQGVVARYDKINLVPASEYVPGKDTLLFHWLYRLIRSFVPEGFVSFAVGEGPVLVDAGARPDGTPWRLAPNICFEISFPELLRRSVLAGADVHVCPANDAWFVRGKVGEATATAELALARDHSIYRAIETRRPVVRCVNRGVSMVVDPTGKVTDEVFSVMKGKKTVVGIQGSFTAEVPVTRLRPLYLRVGDAFALACLAGTFALLGLAWRGTRLARDLAEGGIPLPPPPTTPPDGPFAGDPPSGPSPEAPPADAPAAPPASTPPIPTTEAEAGSPPPAEPGPAEPR